MLPKQNTNNPAPLLQSRGGPVNNLAIRPEVAKLITNGDSAAQTTK